MAPPMSPVVVGARSASSASRRICSAACSAAATARALLDPGPFRGVLPLPYHLIRATEPVWHNPANHHRAVPLTFEQFRYGFANAVSEDEAKDLYETFAVPVSGTPIFQAASANLNPRTEAKVDTINPDRGPLLIVSGGEDNTVPSVVARAAYPARDPEARAFKALHMGPAAQVPRVQPMPNVRTGCVDLDKLRHLGVGECSVHNLDRVATGCQVSAPQSSRPSVEPTGYTKYAPKREVRGWG